MCVNSLCRGGQSTTLGVLLPLWVSKIELRFDRLAGKHLHFLSHIASPLWSYFKQAHSSTQEAERWTDLCEVKANLPQTKKQKYPSPLSTSPTPKLNKNKKWAQNTQIKCSVLKQWYRLPPFLPSIFFPSKLKVSLQTKLVLWPACSPMKRLEWGAGVGTQACVLGFVHHWTSPVQNF